MNHFPSWLIRNFLAGAAILALFSLTRACGKVQNPINPPKAMKTAILSLALLLASLPAFSQITSAEDRIRRERNNSRPAMTFDQVAASRFDLTGRVFFFVLSVPNDPGLEQIEANRWQFRLSRENGTIGGFAQIPRAGAEALPTMKNGDVVLARLKEGATDVLEILGVSEVGVWE